jgi:hypothetical protein
LDKDQFTGSLSATNADRVMFYINGSYRSYFLLKGSTRSGTYNQWTAEADATLASADDTIIPPGSGVMLRVVRLSKAIVTIGCVRTDAFAHRLVPGNNFIANPWPIATSPADSRMGLEHGFTGTRSPTTSDQIQLFDGTAFRGFWLVKAGTSYRHWTPLTDATLSNASDQDLMAPSAGFFLKVQPTTAARPWIIPAPWQMQQGAE